MTRKKMQVTLEQIAKISGSCRSTVHKVVHGRPGVKEETRRRILQIMEDLNYKPNLAGRALQKTKKTVKILAVLFDSDSTQYIKEGIDEQQRLYQDFGLQVEIYIVKLYDVARQIAILREAEKEDISGVILAAFNNPKLITEVNRLVTQGVPVITINADIPESKRVCFIGQDFYTAGRTAAHILARFLGGKGDIAVIMGTNFMYQDIARTEGFVNILQGFPDIRIVKTIITEEDSLKTYQETVSLLRQEPKLKGIYITTGRVKEAGRALSALGFGGKITVVSFDTYPEIRELVRQGVIECTIGQNFHRQGALPVQLLFQQIYQGEALPEGKLFGPIDIRLAENIDMA
jgi:LacI family transcriptional regulator